MSLRYWIAPIVTSGLLLIAFVVLLERIETRIAVRQSNLDQELKRLRAELLVDTQALDLEMRQQTSDCAASPKRGE